MTKDTRKMYTEQCIVISLGGSILVPNTIDTEYVYSFTKFLLEISKAKKKCCIIVGGGRTARAYIQSLSEVAKKQGVLPPSESLDWLGIQSTKLNAQLLKESVSALAQKHTHMKVFPKIVNTLKNIDFTEYNILFVYGMKPGSSTDYVATRFATHLGAKTVYNFTDVEYVYTKNPKKYSDAKPVFKCTWNDFKDILQMTSWKAGAHAPFDPIASQYAQKKGLKVVILNGLDLQNATKSVLGKKAKGTSISDA